MLNISRVAFVLFNRIGILLDSKFVLCNRILIESFSEEVLADLEIFFWNL